MDTTDEKDRNINGQKEQDHPQEEDQPSSKRKKGGFITMPFIIANESFEKVASYGLMPNMILYLIKDYKMSVSQGTNLIFLWSAATNFLPLVGAFLADSFLGRFLTIAFGSITSLLGMILLWLTTAIPTAKPPPCDPLAHNCQSPTAGQIALLVFAFLLVSIGAGGVRPCSQAFGADQFDQRDNPKNRRVLETFFNWYYASACLSVVIALTVIVYIQDHLGWKTGFGIPAILMFLSAVFFLLASPFYVKNKVERSLFTSFVRVAVAAYRNRQMTLQPPGSNVQYCHNKEDSAATVPSDRLRFLNKACIISNPDQDIGSEGLPKDRWRLCTVEEVEELKALIRVLPIWSSAIMMSINTASQSTFPVLQAKTMDRHLGSRFEVPAGSFGTFLVIVIVLWIPIYDRVILPLASKIHGKPVRLSVKVRMGVGLFCTFTAMMVAGLVENIRRHKAIASNGQAMIHMSAMWLIPQFAFNGLAEAFNGIGQTEFYYSEFPKNMSSIATCLSGLGMAVGNLLASVILNLVDHVTKRRGKESWVSNNINQGHYDYYYWLLAALSFFNLSYYILCSRCYGPVLEERNKVVHEKERFPVEEEMAMLRTTCQQEKGEELKEDLGLSKSVK